MVGVAVVMSAFSALAQEPNAATQQTEAAASPGGRRDLVLAESLFREGRALMMVKKYAEACPKLEESYNADPGVGSLILLAGCHEALGRTATAWAEFRTAASLSKKDGRSDREQLATRRAEALERSLAYLLVTLRPGARVSVLLDGRPLPAPSLGAKTPVDPGMHLIEAKADGYETWQARLSFVAAETATVEVGDLKATRAAPSARASEPSALAPPSQVETGSTWRWIGLGIGGAGIVGLGVGGYFGIRALSLGGDLKARCDPARCSDPQGIAIHNEASQAATVANVALPMGVLAAGLGTYLFLANPKTDARRGSTPRVFPTANGSSYGVVAVGSLP